MSGGWTETTYPLELADAFLCVPACINILLGRRGLRSFPQEQIAQELGLVVPPTHAAMYPWAVTSDQEADWGVHPQAKETSLTSFLRRHNIPLVELFYRPAEIFGRDYPDFICANLAHDNDVLVGYDFRTVFGEGRRVGHVSIISGINPESGELRLIEPEQATVVCIPIHDLLRGIAAKKDGFWVVGSPLSIEWCQRNY